MARFARTLALGCLVALFTSLPSWGAPPRDRATPARLAQAAAQTLARLWRLVLPSLPGKAGTIADPHGQCGTGPNPPCGDQPAGEAGTIIDPNGEPE